ncbi:MAG TPA: biotin--[acetyl-CoA-carboxylase] ligase [Flavobacteriia bacterium]|nr:biotin--[acetyl-CoA-carboxylase] ligase [Flavobacteriia bacterium]
MKIIKLSAIESTNDFLKRLAENDSASNGTIVQANFQFKGKGQLHKTWQSEAGKNLLFSVLYEFSNLKIAHRFYLNKIVSITISSVLNHYVKNVKIKWPNDIMAHNNKISGVLIENVFVGDLISKSIIGIGINVNQIKFDNLPKVTSLKKELKKEINIDFLLLELIDELNKNIQLLQNKKFSEIDKLYFKKLYRFLKPSMYYNKKNGFFMAKIIDVLQNGLLKMELEDESICLFDLKEIQFL